MNLLKKLFTISYKEILPLLVQAKKESKRSYLDIIKDLYHCQKQGYSWADYFAFRFASNQDEAYRKSFISVNIHYPIISKLFPTNEAENDFFDDKGKFNENFKEFKNIDCLDLRKDGIEKLEVFLKKHQNFFVKEAKSCGGVGVKYIDQKFLASYDLKSFYNYLLQKKFYIVEEKISQHKHLDKLSVNSLNSLRVVTVKAIDGSISAPFVVSKVSISEAYVDNASSGGAYTLLNDKGEVYASYHSFLPILKFYDKNPITNFNYIGFKFPYYQEAIEMCLKAASRCKNHYIGWDVAISEKGPILIEANTAPGAQLTQGVNQLINNKGHLEILEKAFKVKLK